MTQLILASSSPYRKALLQRLGLTFITLAPEIDEAALPQESARDLVERLARAKARAVLGQQPTARVIGSDQVAALDLNILSKPHTIANACAQLQACSGREVVFFTGLCVAQADQELYRLSTTQVKFRTLSDHQIRHYIERELPLDCAGSFKCEGLGISLFETISSIDPTSLIGLPLIDLTNLLTALGAHPLDL